MRLRATLLVLWMALVGVLSPVLACAMPHADMDCCAPDAPADCRIAWSFDRTDAMATALTQAPSLESLAAPPVSFDLPPPPYSEVVLAVAPASDFLADAALTWLRTGRLRL
jgi:hypothetical protein